MWEIIKLVICIILLLIVFREIYVYYHNEYYKDKFQFNEKTLRFEPYPMKSYKLNLKYIMKVFDIVKWKKPQNSVENKDTMVVTDLYGINAVQVTHLNDNTIGVERAENLEVVGHCNSVEEAKNIKL